jgi:hypothetical protein
VSECGIQKLNHQSKKNKNLIWYTSKSEVLYFAYDLILIQYSEDKLQTPVFRLNEMCTSYNFKI